MNPVHTYSAVISERLTYRKVDFIYLIQTDKVTEAPALVVAQVLLDELWGQRLASPALLGDIPHEPQDDPPNS